MAAVEFVTASTKIGMDRRYKTIVTSSAGYPLDKTYYQTVKGMVTPLDILEPGGTLIIASSCSEGFGSPEFREAQTRLVAMGPERFLATLTAKSLAEIDEWQTEMQMKAMRIGEIALYTTGLDAEERRITGVTLAPTVRRGPARGDRAPQRPGRRLHPRRPLRRAGLCRRMSLSIRLDAVGGVAGDMFAAAMVDACPICATACLVMRRGAAARHRHPGVRAGHERRAALPALPAVGKR